MDVNWSSYDLPTLKILYEAEAARLRDALINGSTWEETWEQRKKVTDLAIALHKKRTASSNPAETSLRD